MISAPSSSSSFLPSWPRSPPNMTKSGLGSSRLASATARFRPWSQLRTNLFPYICCMCASDIYAKVKSCLARGALSFFAAGAFFPNATLTMVRGSRPRLRRGRPIPKILSLYFWPLSGSLLLEFFKLPAGERFHERNQRGFLIIRQVEGPDPSAYVWIDLFFIGTGATPVIMVYYLFQRL